MKHNLRILLSLFLLALFQGNLDAQSYAFGLKGGLLAGTQQWEGQDRSLMFKGHGVIFIESAEEESDYSVYAEAGIHQRGSARRNLRFVDPNGNLFNAPSEEYIFNNVSLTLGAKDKRYLTDDAFFYYGLGVRVEYTVGTNLDIFRERFENIYGPNVLIGYPIDEFVRKWNYGITVLGGLEWHWTEFIAGVAELRVSPDFSSQYLQPPIGNAYDPVTGNTRSYNEQKAYNISIELSVGMRFLRKIIYID